MRRPLCTHCLFARLFVRPFARLTGSHTTTSTRFFYLLPDRGLLLLTRQAVICVHPETNMASREDSFDSTSVETINNLPARRRDMPLDESGVPVARVGKARGQEHDFFDTIGQSGRLELVKCQFCGLERTRISLRMRDHLARKCPGGIPPDLRQQFLKSLPAFNRSNGGQNGTTAAAARKRPVKAGDGVHLSDDRMIDKEHDLKMKKMKAELDLAEEQKRVVTVVGTEIIRVLQTFDTWLRTGRVAAFMPNAFPHQQPPNTHF